MKKQLLLSAAMAAALCAPLRAQDDEPAEFKEILKKLPQIQKDLEGIRGVKFKRDVAAKYQSADDFRKYVEKGIKDEYPKEKLDAQNLLFGRLGLLPKGCDLGKEVTDLVAAQALAYYDPPQGTFFVVKPDVKGMEFTVSVLHELQHAIQDQVFGLGVMQKEMVHMSDDQQLAARFLIEGEATYVMLIYAGILQGMPQAQAEGSMSMQLGMLSNLDREKMIEMQKMQAMMQGGEMTESQKAQLESMKNSPRYLYNTLSDPYYKGAFMVCKVKDAGGWKAVNDLWKNLPQSSEQCLHPEKLIGKRDVPMLITLPELGKAFGEGWTRSEGTTLGEHGMRTMFREVVGDDSVDACAGWDGDRVELYRAGDKHALVWHTTWDSEADAKEFASAYKGALFAKYKAEGKVEKGVLLISKDGEELYMTKVGSDVLIIEGAPKGRAAEVAKAVLAGAKKEEAKPFTGASPEVPATPKAPKREAY